jgi:hypothetical protein
MYGGISLNQKLAIPNKTPPNAPQHKIFIHLNHLGKYVFTFKNRMVNNNENPIANPDELTAIMVLNKGKLGKMMLIYPSKTKFKTKKLKMYKI